MTTSAAKTGSRSAARRAAEAMAKRAQEFAAREKAIEELVTSFHAAAEKAEKVRSGAQDKAAALREKGETDAAGFDAQAEAAVREILGAGESPESAARLTGWTTARVRQAQRAAQPAKRSATRVRPSATTATGTPGEN